jgi:hypothetical protein
MLCAHEELMRRVQSGAPKNPGHELCERCYFSRLSERFRLTFVLHHFGSQGWEETYAAAEKELRGETAALTVTDPGGEEV